MVHPTEKDLWLLLAAWGPLPVIFVVAIHRLLTSGCDQAFWILGGLVVFYLGIMLVCAWPVSYEIAPECLIVRSGVTRQEIPLSDIRKVSPSNNLLSAPAWSVHRLRVDYRKGGKERFQLISPESRETFLDEMARAAGLEHDGDGLVRSSA